MGINVDSQLVVISSENIVNKDDDSRYIIEIDSFNLLKTYKCYTEIPNCSGIYIIFNIINGRYYIGRSACLRERLERHYKQISLGSNLSLQCDIRKYGINNFRIKIREYPNISNDELKKIEDFQLNLYVGREKCYNLSRNAGYSKFSEGNYNNRYFLVHN